MLPQALIMPVEVDKKKKEKEMMMAKGADEIVKVSCLYATQLTFYFVLC